MATQGYDILPPSRRMESRCWRSSAPEGTDTADLGSFLALRVKLKLKLKREAESLSSESLRGEEPPSMLDVPCRERKAKCCVLLANGLHTCRDTSGTWPTVWWRLMAWQRICEAHCYTALNRISRLKTFPGAASLSVQIWGSIYRPIRDFVL